MMKKILNFILNKLNVHPDHNQRWILISLFMAGLLGTYISPRITKEIISELPAEWLAFQSLASSAFGLLLGVLWQKKIRATAIKYFMYFAIAESSVGCLLGLYLAFIQWNVWVFAVVSLLYSMLICKFVSKCIMAFKAALWVEQQREVYDNNTSIVSGIVCIIGFAVALVLMPSLKTALILWSLCCIFDDIGWIIVYYKNRDSLRDL